MAGKKKSKPAERKPAAKKAKPAKPEKKKASASGENVKSEAGSKGFTLSLRGDRSLGAYKNFVFGMLKAVKPDAKDPYTEEQWVEKWTDFWAKVDEAAEKKKTAGPDATPAASVKEYKTAEEQYPGITKQIRQFEEMQLPSCPHCGSADTASVQVGVIGRTMYIAGSTRKFKLVPNMKDKKGKYYCNNCKKYFD